jgi:elongator complex protein 1
LETLDLYKYQPDHFNDINQLYADYLLSHSKPQEAAIGRKLSRLLFSAFLGIFLQTETLTFGITVYESLRLYDSAYKAYQLAHLWRESLLCAMLVPLDNSHMRDFALDTANTLEENKDYVSAAYIHAEHLKDIPMAARLFCRGSRFTDASRLLVLNDRRDLIPEIIEAMMTEAMGNMTDFLADCKSQLQAQIPRIRELREKRVTDPLAFFGGDPLMGDGDLAGADIPDNVSLAPTDASTTAGHSLFTRYTNESSSSRYTSRTRRREERKRARGKHGTVYEEEYLINSVRRLVERVNSILDDVETLIEALLRHGMRERALAVDKAVQGVLQLCKDGITDAFPSSVPFEKPGMNMNTDVGSKEQKVAVYGGDAVLFDSIQSRDTAVAPIVKEFHHLALLS